MAVFVSKFFNSYTSPMSACYSRFKYQMESDYYGSNIMAFLVWSHVALLAFFYHKSIGEKMSQMHGASILWGKVLFLCVGKYVNPYLWQLLLCCTCERQCPKIYGVSSPDRQQQAHSNDEVESSLPPFLSVFLFCDRIDHWRGVNYSNKAGAKSHQRLQCPHCPQALLPRLCW